MNSSHAKNALIIVLICVSGWKLYEDCPPLSKAPQYSVVQLADDNGRVWFVVERIDTVLGSEVHHGFMVQMPSGTPIWCYGLDIATKFEMREDAEYAIGQLRIHRVPMRSAGREN